LKAARILAGIAVLASFEACGWIIGDASTIYVPPDAGDAASEGAGGALEAGTDPGTSSEAGRSAEAGADGHPPAANPAVGLAAWGGHVCAVRSDRTVACWGDNPDGVLDNNSPYWTYMPTPVIGVSGIPIVDAVQVAVGYEHACVRASDGTVACWGSTVHLATGTFPSAISGGGWLGAKGWAFTLDGDPFGDFNCTIDATQRVLCWGSNTHGALGHTPGTMGDAPCDSYGGTYLNACNTLPVAVAGLPPVRKVALDDGGGCAVTVAGNVACWGWNDDGELGSLDGGDSPAPVNILLGNGQPLAGVTDVYGGHNTFCALQSSTGKLYCWGHTYEYETGRAADGASSTAVPVEFDNGMIPGITAAAIGQRHACVVADTNVWCAGWNVDFEVGTGVSNGNGGGGTYCVGDPSKVLGPDGKEPLSGVVEVAAGWSSTCARTTDGALYCWGMNDLGQTGHQPGTLTDVICGAGYCTPVATRVDTF
jgi:alpha-tubulin suppressor-like RCC1 family protein